MARPRPVPPSFVVKNGSKILSTFSAGIPISRAIYMHPSGVKVIPAGMSVMDLKRHFRKNLRDAILDLVGGTEFVLLDAAAGLGFEAKSTMAASNEILIVTNPELPAVTDALKAVEVAKEFNTVPVGVVINKYTGDKYEMDPKNIAEFLGVPVIAVIPDSKFARISIKRRSPVVIDFPNTEIAKRFKKLAAYLMGEKYEYLEKGSSFWGRLKDIFSRQ
jgi:septum site-determining protein MinD